MSAPPVEPRPPFPWLKCLVWLAVALAAGGLLAWAAAFGLRLYEDSTASSDTWPVVTVCFDPQVTLLQDALSKRGITSQWWSSDLGKTSLHVAPSKLSRAIRVLREESCSKGYSLWLPIIAFPIRFEFPTDDRGWFQDPSTSLSVQDGSLILDVRGPSPSVTRTLLRIPASRGAVLVLRMKTDIATGGRFSWSTKLGEADDGAVPFSAVPDDVFHDIRLPVGENPGWKGTIQAIQIDWDVPPGAPTGRKLGTIAIESIRAER